MGWPGSACHRHGRDHRPHMGPQDGRQLRVAVGALWGWQPRGHHQPLFLPGEECPRRRHQLGTRPDVEVPGGPDHQAPGRGLEGHAQGPGRSHRQIRLVGRSKQVSATDGMTIIGYNSPQTKLLGIRT